MVDLPRLRDRERRCSNIALSRPGSRQCAGGRRESPRGWSGLRCMLVAGNARSRDTRMAVISIAQTELSAAVVVLQPQKEPVTGLPSSSSVRCRDRESSLKEEADIIIARLSSQAGFFPHPFSASSSMVCPHQPIQKQRLLRNAHGNAAAFPQKNGCHTPLHHAHFTTLYLLVSRSRQPGDAEKSYRINKTGTGGIRRGNHPQKRNKSSYSLHFSPRQK